ncbi:MAG: SRPBCC family protein [Verrucomicrobiota bacterium]
MKNGKVTDIIPAPAAEVFALLHNYDRRLEWDTLLSSARLDSEFPAAAKGAVSTCRGRWALGGIALRTRYVTFHPGEVAAVEMVNRPAFFDTFAASIRHRNVPEGGSEITYQFRFSARPVWLRKVLEPVMARIFRWETGKRLKALRAWFQNRKA